MSKVKLEINKDYERRFNSIFVEENSKLNYEKDPEGKMASNWYVEYDIKIPEKSILYMLYDDSVKNIYNIFSVEQIEKVKMNNDEDQILFDILSIESFEDINMEKYNVKRIKSYYPSPFDDSIVELGIFENEVITIRLSFAYISNDVDVSSIKFGLLDFEKYKELGYNIPDTKAYCDQNKVSIEVNSPDSNKSLFLPLVYDESIIVKNNGKQVKAEQALNALISIPLEKGENRIEITYKNV